MDKKSFSKREWIFTIIMISIVQAAIWYISFVNSGSKNALNYVSFSGTIISIILAILAIGYTYGESISQKNKSDGISTQISMLSEVVKDVSAQAESISKITAISKELNTLAERLEDGFNQTKSEMSSVSKTLESFINETSKSQNINIAPFNLDKKQVINNLLSARNPLFEISLLFIIFANGKTYQHNSEMIEDSVARIISKVKANNEIPEHYKENNIERLFTGSVLALITVLKGLGLLTVAEKEYIIEDEFVEIIRDVILKDPRSSGPFYTLIRQEAIEELGTFR